MKRNKGFTLIELLVVIAIVVILMAATLVAINPFEQIQQANDANRWAGVNTIMSAIYQNVIINEGTFICGAGVIPTSPTLMQAPATPGYDICDCLVSTYVGALPVDPQNGVWDTVSGCSAAYNTRFEISQLGGTMGRITINATDAGGGPITIIQ